MGTKQQGTLVIGAVMADIVCEVPHLPARGMGVAATSTRMSAGGCAFNTARAIKRDGGACTLVAPIGHGRYASFLESELASRGIAPMHVDTSLDCGACICLVEPTGQEAFTIFAQDMGRTGHARGTLAIRDGLEAPVPARDPRPLLTMADMGHDMGGHGAHKGMEGGCGAMMGEGGCGANMGAMDHSAHGAPSNAPNHPAGETGNPLVDMQSSASEPKLDDPGIGLRDNGRQVLTYGAMRSLFDDPDGREPGRTVELHLTGHMEKFAWSFDGIPFASAEPLRLKYGERMRIVLVNDTMMQHPIHLHGVWSDLEDADGGFQLRKHTIDMPPGTRRSYRVRADALGRWAFHCHLLYHMEAGMMREVRIEA